MTKANLKQLAVADLVTRYAANSIAQYRAELLGATRRSLFKEMIAIEAELRARQGDQRSALTALFTHENPEVRLNAAKATLTVAGDKARQVLQELGDSMQYPQAAEAGMTLSALAKGTFVPT